MVKNWILQLGDYLHYFNRRILIKIQLTQIRRSKLQKFKDLGDAVFNLILNKAHHASKDPSIKGLVEELTEYDKEINRLNQELKRR